MNRDPWSITYRIVANKLKTENIMSTIKKADGLFKILIGIILCLEFWTLGKTQCKQCVRHASMMSPRMGDVGRKSLRKKKSIAFSSTVTRRLYPQCCARHSRQRSLASE
ncbi:hypothetical protein HN011_001571 [Eciton burchellii]|nr:hypothetical protein HN011_001571 [Eciton burchellii]